MKLFGFRRVSDPVVDQNFKILQDRFSNLLAYDAGIAEVTGTLQVPTKLTKVLFVVATLASQPSANVAYVRAQPSGMADENVLIRTYTSGFVQATNAANINWIAVGNG